MKNLSLVRKKICTLFFVAAFSGIVLHAQDANIEVLRENIKISSPVNIHLKSGVGGKAYYNDKEIATKGELGRSSTVVVAAFNASEKSKAGADFVCTGTNDNYAITSAVNYIKSTGVGGKIQLTEGDYNFHNGVWVVAISNNEVLSITIEGMGDCTIVHRRFSSINGKNQGLFIFGLPVNANITNQYVTTIKNMRYNGHMDEYQQPVSTNQTFATSYTDRSDVLETTILENIVCENVYNPATIFAIVGSNLIARSLEIIGGYSSFGINVYSNLQENNLFTIIENCKVLGIGARNISNSFIVNNVSEVMSVRGERIVCTGNIYKTFYNNTTNSLVSNNLQVTQ